MKKLFNSRFLFILASSLVVLILLIIGAFYLFDNEDDSFVRSGYVLNPLSSTTEKYFFEENVGYRENLSSMIEFVDVDEKKVSILKDSFIHYNDESISFLKNGAILDLDSLSGNKMVYFYNITNKSIIENKDTGYVIETASGQIKLNNFIGRISDDKYIVAGDLSLKMAGNSTSIKGEYFEVVYIDEGIVNIENKDVKYQVAAEGTIIYVGNNKTIDFGDKKITLDGADAMSITAITIDGDENIEIIPKAPDEEDDGDKEEGEGNEPTNPGNTGNEVGGEEEGGTGQENVTGEVTKELVITLKDVKVASTNIGVVFDILNASDDDSFKLQVVNLDSGRTEFMADTVLSDVLIDAKPLTPNTKYLFMVINNKDNSKYFQKVLETDGFGIRVEKTYATDDSLSYEITVDEGTDITNAKFSLKKFNEETMTYDIVTSSYYDVVAEKEIVEEKVTDLKTLVGEGSIEGTHKITYTGLDSDTIYTAVLDDFSVAPIVFTNVYEIAITSMTLKKTPLFEEMEETITKDVGEGSFDLSLGKVNDPDNAIINYTYQIFEKNSGEKAVEDIVHNNASPIKVLIGDEKNQLKNDTNYFYKVIIEYFDNEKYLDYIIADNIIFNMGSEPYIAVEKNTDLISFDKIAGSIYLTDNSCKIPVNGREKCAGADEAITYIKISKPDGDGGKVGFRTIPFKFTVDEDGKLEPYEFVVNGLEAGTKYYIDVVTYNESLEEEEILHVEGDDKYISTKSFTTFSAKWTRLNGTKEIPIVANVKLSGKEGTGSLTPDESAATIESIVLKLYDGKNIQNIETADFIGYRNLTSADLNLKENFYDNEFRFTNETFYLDAEALASKSKDGKLNGYYTVFMEVYAEGGNKIQLENEVFTYTVSPAIFNDAETILEISKIKNTDEPELFPNLGINGTVIGYNVYSYYDRDTMIAGGMEPVAINFYVYDRKKEKISFLVKNEDGELVPVEDKDKGYTLDVRKDEFFEHTLKIYMDYGSDYETIDELMRRGNSFYIGFEIVSKTGDLYPLANDGISPTGFGMYEYVSAEEKEQPTFTMYIASSTADSITYRYEILDPDNAVYKEMGEDEYGFYHIIGNGVETKIPMTKDVEFTDYNKYSGELTLSDLKNGNKYSLYYKRNIIKSDMLSIDVQPVNNDIKIFDGYYDLGESINEYNFKYQILNDPLNDNKVIIKILAEDDILDRILSYDLKFTSKDDSGKEIILEKNLWNLSKCDNDKSGAKERCLTVDYIELYDAGMKSDVNKIRPISLSVTAVYDNGLQGFDLLKDKNNKYSIMQGNSTEAGMGGYLTYATKAKESLATFFAWSKDAGVGKGYYTTKMNHNTNQLTYTNMTEFSVDKNGNKTNIEGRSRLTLTPNGYYYSNAKTSIYVTPKMVSMDNMGCYTLLSGACNEFWFNTVTPTVKVSDDTTILNGAIKSLNLYSLNLDDIKKEKDGKHYLYIEVWDNVEDAKASKFSNVVRPAVKVEIKKNETMRAVIDGLKEYNFSEGIGQYWFNIYAYMNDGNNTYRQLYDEDSVGYQVISYSLVSLMPSEMFDVNYVKQGKYGIKYITSNEVYGNRTLKTSFKLKPYLNSTAYNFDLVYTLCDRDKLDVCSPTNPDSYIFKDEILKQELSDESIKEMDISKYNLEYDREYLLSIYAVTSFYDSGNDNKLTNRYVLINPSNRIVKLDSLKEPTFIVTRKAFLEDGENGIEFTVTVDDSSKTLIDGHYYVKLFKATDSDEKVVVGEMKLLDKDKNYYDVADYQNYAFDAFETKKTIRIVGLEENTLYSFEVYGDAYMNNYNVKHKCNGGLVIDDNGECVLPSDGNMLNKEKIKRIDKTYTAYSVNEYGIAFGNPTFAMAKKSVLIKFSYGSNFDNVSKVDYTIGKWDGVSMSGTKNGSYLIPKDKQFGYDEDTDQYTLLISDYIGEDGYILLEQYKVIVKFTLKDPVTGEEVVGIYPEFSDELTYYDENESNKKSK